MKMYAASRNQIMTFNLCQVFVIASINFVATGLITLYTAFCWVRILIRIAQAILYKFADCVKITKSLLNKWTTLFFGTPVSFLPNLATTSNLSSPFLPFLGVIHKVRDTLGVGGVFMEIWWFIIRARESPLYHVMQTFFKMFLFINYLTSFTNWK